MSFRCIPFKNRAAFHSQAMLARRAVTFLVFARCENKNSGCKICAHVHLLKYLARVGLLSYRDSP